MSAELDPDAALMLRVKQGDSAAFAQLVDKYKRPVINLLHRTLRDATEAEDVAQNVFVQVYKSAHRYRASAKFSTWLFTIARNLCLNEIRRRSRHRAKSLDAPHPEQEDTPGHHFEDVKGFSPPAALLHERSEEHTSELQSQFHLVCRLMLEKKKNLPYSNPRRQAKNRKKNGK